jgi:hypothetical protein
MMLERFFLECAEKQWSYRISGSQWITQIHGMLAEQARAQATVSGESHAVARPAIRV